MEPVSLRRFPPSPDRFLHSFVRIPGSLVKIPPSFVRIPAPFVKILCSFSRVLLLSVPFPAPFVWSNGASISSPAAPVTGASGSASAIHLTRHFLVTTAPSARPSHRGWNILFQSVSHDILLPPLEPRPRLRPPTKHRAAGNRNAETPSSLISPNMPPHGGSVQSVKSVVSIFLSRVIPSRRAFLRPLFILSHSRLFA
jgi:hypothetical protein